MPMDYSGAGSIHALLARFTKLDASGAPATGPDNVFWTDALVKLSLGINLNEPDPIRQVNGAGLTCMVYQAPKTVDSLNVDTFSFCTPDPRITEFLVGGDILTNATHESQQIAITGSPTSGGFVLVTSAGPTATIPYNATAAAVTSAINAVLGAGAVKSTGGPLPASPVVATFQNQTNVATMTATSTLGGGSGPAVAITTVTEGGAGSPLKAVGYAAPAVGLEAKPNGVAVELWSRAVSGGAQVGYLHWLFPRMSLSLGSDGFEFNAEDPLTPTFSGSGSENPNYTSGADGTWGWISNRVYQWVQENTLPTYTPGYASLTGS
jgi:hypothetical protein